jgi:hypothetical protein
MYKLLLILFPLLVLSQSLRAQNQIGEVVMARIIDNDTIITIDLPEYCHQAKLPRKFKNAAKKRSKLVYNVKKVYPWAKLAGIKLNEYEEILKNAENDSERKKIMKIAEQELKDEFEDDLKKLTFTQGLILIKLVDRETGNSSYALVQELRGNFVAFFWQTFARMFGFNLKTEYDPNGEDKEIEEIVVMIENGEI